MLNGELNGPYPEQRRLAVPTSSLVAVAWIRLNTALGSGSNGSCPFRRMSASGPVRNCIIFDNGIKKVPPPHQYAVLKAAQERIRKREAAAKAS